MPRRPAWGGGRTTPRAPLRAGLFPESQPVSHLVQIKTKLHDIHAIRAACGRLALAAPREGTAQLYGDQTATGILVHLGGWKYPLVIDTATGTVRFDNFAGHWGDSSRIDQFRQAYAIEKAKIEARKRGHQVNEIAQPDGSIRLTITGAKL